jgi:hypothetical protein
MKIKEAIKKAIEGGYIDLKDFQEAIAGLERITSHEVAKQMQYSVLLDPDFWKYLGKSENWGKTDIYEYEKPIQFWLLNWHNFIDNLAQGQDIETAFDNATN